MTTIRFDRRADRILGFSCQGHSGYADAGADIVCAAVTSAVRMAECTINDVLCAGAEVSVHEKTATITLRLPFHCENEQGCQAVLLGMETYLRELSRENPHHLTVLEV